MRFSLLTLILVVLLAGSVLAFIIRFPAWRLSRTMKFQTPLKVVQLADNGNKLVAIADQIYIHDRHTGAEVLRLPFRKDQDEYFTVTAISKQRDAIAFYDLEGRVSIYSLRTLKRITQTEPVKGMSNPRHHLRFSEGGAWVLVPVKQNEYNAYSLAGEKKTPLLRADRPFHITQYFESAGIVFKTAPDSGTARYSTQEFYSLAEGRVVFENKLPPGGWVHWGCGIAPDGSALFASGLGSRVARLDLTRGDRGPVQEKDFVLPLEQNLTGQSDARYSPGVILWKWDPVPLQSACQFTLYSMSDLKPFARFNSRQGDAYVVAFDVDESRRRVFLNLYSMSSADPDRERFEVVDTQTGEVLFAVRGRSVTDFDPRANCVLVGIGRPDVQIFIRDHPEWWWGHLCRIETWLILLFAALLVHRFFSRAKPQ